MNASNWRNAVARCKQPFSCSRMKHEFCKCVTVRDASCAWMLIFVIFIARQHSDARYWYSNSARLSVCLSVFPYVPVSDENGLTYRHSFTPYGSPIILFLSASNIFTKFWRCHPCGSDKYRWGIKISRFSPNKSLYLANDTIYRHSYYRGRIGNRTQAFEWHQFQWPWVTSNPDFKVAILFNFK